MDISYVFGSQKFNYRVCAVIVSENRILAMHDERSPYFYLPGGRVKLGETAEAAVLREIREELGITASIVRPLWLNQGFFTEDVDGLDYHELCVYFLMDISFADLASKGERFTLFERGHRHDFEWLPFERLRDEYFYPVFLKTAIFDLPESFVLRTENEQEGAPMNKPVILLNGPSSSGKSTLAKTLQKQLRLQRGEEFSIVSIDDFMKLRTDETIYEDDVFEISGEMCEACLKALKTHSGVIIDHVITSERIFEELRQAVEGFRLFPVRVVCPLEVLEKRERERGNRCPGSARSSYEYLYPKDGYELSVDTSVMTPGECASAILKKLLTPAG